MKYSLVNPFITGTLRTTTHASTDIQAAKKLYSRMAQYFNNNLPSFFFSIQDSKGKFYHYEVNERQMKNDINFTIRSVDMKKKGENKIAEIMVQKKKGGSDKKKDDSSSSSSSSDSPQRYYLSPFVDYMYLMGYYVVDDYAVDRVFFPTFVPYLAEVNPLIIWGP